MLFSGIWTLTCFIKNADYLVKILTYPGCWNTLIPEEVTNLNDERLIFLRKSFAFLLLLKLVSFITFAEEVPIINLIPLFSIWVGFRFPLINLFFHATMSCCFFQSFSNFSLLSCSWYKNQRIPFSYEIVLLIFFIQKKCCFTGLIF